MRMYIIIEVVEGINQTPKVFGYSSQAEREFEITIMSKGFRAKKPEEVFRLYLEEFWEWENTKECPYDKMDWQLEYWDNVRLTLL